MTRTEALRHFNENEVAESCNQTLLALDKFYHEHREELVPDFLESMGRLCRKIKQIQEKKVKGKIGFIHYSMLRTAIIDQSYRYLTEAHDRSWYLDTVECMADYNADWAFGFLNSLAKELERKRRVYFNRIIASDIQKIVLRQAERFNCYVVKLIRHGMNQAELLPEFREIDKEPEFEVRVGEYFDLNEIVYKQDTREKNSQTVKRWLERKLDNEYAYEALQRLDLSNGRYEGIDLRYADLRGSRLSGADLSGSVLVGTRFDKGHLEKANLSNAIVYEANFSGCNLQGASLAEVEGASGLPDGVWQRPGFDGVNFNGADLKGADLTGANLKGADFRGADLAGVNFNGARLAGARFLERESGNINLGEEQSRLVIWE